MKSEQNITQDRKYFVDWLRILLIISVFLYHTGMVFVPWGWHVNFIVYCIHPDIRLPGKTLQPVKDNLRYETCEEELAEESGFHRFVY